VPENAAAVVNRFERRRQRSRAALIDAAIELFQEKGIAETKLEDICRRADVAPRTFFNHFETRDHLYRAIAHQRAVQLADRLAALDEDPRPFARRLHDLFAEIGAYLAARPLYRQVVTEMLHVRTEGGAELVRSHVLGQAALRFVREGVRRGEIARRHRPEILADILLGALTVAISNWGASDRYDLERSLQETARALLDLFAPAASDRRPPAADRKARRR